MPAAVHVASHACIVLKSIQLSMPSSFHITANSSCSAMRPPCYPCLEKRVTPARGNVWGFSAEGLPSSCGLLGRCEASLTRACISCSLRPTWYMPQKCRFCFVAEPTVRVLPNRFAIHMRLALMCTAANPCTHLLFAGTGYGGVWRGLAQPFSLAWLHCGGVWRGLL